MWISQLLLIGLLSTKKAADSTPLLAVLPLLTYGFYEYSKRRFEPAFRKYPLEVRSLACLVLLDVTHLIFTQQALPNGHWLLFLVFC